MSRAGGWLLPVPAGMLILGYLCCPRSLGLTWLCCRLHGGAPVHVSVCHSHLPPWKHLTALLLQAVITDTQMYVHAALGEWWELSIGCRALQLVAALLSTGWSRAELILQQGGDATPLAR